MNNNEWYNLSLNEKVKLKRLRKRLKDLIDLNNIDMKDYDGI